MAHYELTITLVVGSGQLPRQVDLDVLQENLEGNFQTHEGQPGLHHRYEEEGLLSTFHEGNSEKGASYILRAYGEQNNSELILKHNERILNSLVDIGVITEEEAEDVDLTLSNHVGNADLNKDLRLESIALGLGLKKTEYEPEVFPSVAYYGDHPCMALISSNGKIVIPGGKTKDEVKETLEGILQELHSVFPSQFDEENTVELID